MKSLRILSDCGGICFSAHDNTAKMVVFWLLQKIVEILRNDLD